MGTISKQDRLHPYAAKIIHRKVRRLVGSYGFTPDDIPDIEQDLMYEVIRRASHFDPLKGSEVQFVSTVVRNGVATIIEHRLAAKRGNRVATVSLDAPMSFGRECERTGHDVIDKQTYLSAKGSTATLKTRVPRGPATRHSERSDLSIDVKRALPNLHPVLCELATRLMESTPSEIAHDTGIPRTTIHDRIKRLRQRFREAGLEDYSKIPPSYRRRFR